MADRLYFFSGSKDVPPGAGANEAVADPARYLALGQVPRWRQQLSNFWVAELQLDGHSYRTVEHCFQAAKIALADPAAALAFTVESGTALGTGDGLAARSARKRVVLDAAQLAVWSARSDGVMERAMHAKFTQHPALGQVLKLTLDAELWHGAGRTRPVRMAMLERVRAGL